MVVGLSSVTMAESTYADKLTCSLYVMQQKQILCDVTLTVDNGKLLAHSAVLAAASDFIRQQFEQVMRSGNRTEYSLHLPGCDLTTLDVVLRLLYTGDLQDSGYLDRVLDVCTCLGVNLPSLHFTNVSAEAELTSTAAMYVS